MVSSGESVSFVFPMQRCADGYCAWWPEAETNAAVWVNFRTGERPGRVDYERERAGFPFELVECTVVVLCGSIECRQERPAQAKGRVPPRRAGSETTLNQVDVPKILLIAQRSTDPTYTARWRVGVRKASP